MNIYEWGSMFKTGIYFIGICAIILIVVSTLELHSK